MAPASAPRPPWLLRGGQGPRPAPAGAGWPQKRPAARRGLLGAVMRCRRGLGYPSVPRRGVSPKSLLIRLGLPGEEGGRGPLLYGPSKPARAAGTSPFLCPGDFLLLGAMGGAGWLSGSPVRALVGGCSVTGGAEPFSADTGCHVSGYRAPDSPHCWPLRCENPVKVAQGAFLAGSTGSCHTISVGSATLSLSSPQPESLLSSPAGP